MNLHLKYRMRTVQVEAYWRKYLRINEPGVAAGSGYRSTIAAKWLDYLLSSWDADDIKSGILEDKWNN